MPIPYSHSNTHHGSVDWNWNISHLRKIPLWLCESPRIEAQKAPIPLTIWRLKLRRWHKWTNLCSATGTGVFDHGRESDTTKAANIYKLTTWVGLLVRIFLLWKMLSLFLHGTGRIWSNMTTTCNLTLFKHECLLQSEPTQRDYWHCTLGIALSCA